MSLIRQKQNYFLKTLELEKNLHYIERREFFSHPTQKWDIYPSYTMLYCFDNDASRPVIVRTGQEKFELSKGKIFYGASCQLMEWSYPQGISSWRAYVSSNENLPQSCMIRTAGSFEELTCLDHYHEVLYRFKKDCFDIVPISETSMIISRYLSENFYASESVLDIYKALGIPSSSAAYSFQKNFGVSPVFFRNKLRIFESLKLMAEGYMIADVCKDVGFDDYTSFYRQFVSTLGVSPVEFKKPSVGKAA